MVLNTYLTRTVRTEIVLGLRYGFALTGVTGVLASALAASADAAPALASACDHCFRADRVRSRDPRGQRSRRCRRRLGIAAFTAGLLPLWKPTLESTRPPAIRGRARVGGTLTCDRGEWRGTTPIRFTFAWLRSGRLHRHASTYYVRKSDAGTRLACRVTATNAAGTRTATSRSVLVAR